MSGRCANILFQLHCAMRWGASRIAEGLDSRNSSDRHEQPATKSPQACMCVQGNAAGRRTKETGTMPEAEE